MSKWLWRVYILILWKEQLKVESLGNILWYKGIVMLIWEKSYKIMQVPVKVHHISNMTVSWIWNTCVGIQHGQKMSNTSLNKPAHLHDMYIPWYIMILKMCNYIKCSSKILINLIGKNVWIQLQLGCNYIVKLVVFVTCTFLFWVNKEGTLHQHGPSMEWNTIYALTNEALPWPKCKMASMVISKWDLNIHSLPIHHQFFLHIYSPS